MTVATDPIIIADGKATLYLADCADVLPGLGKVDAVVTDPPYGNNYLTGHRKGIYRPSTRIIGDKLSEPILNDKASDTKPLLADAAAKLEPLLNDTAAIYWFAAPDRLDMVLPILRERWEVVNVLCWDKGNCTAGDLEASYGKQWEAIVYARTKRYELPCGRPRDVINHPRMNGCDYVHPTQKPDGLIVRLLRCLPETFETVLDPFMGSGTTGVACARLGLKFIGIEKEPDYFEIARRRIEGAYAQQNLQFMGN